MQKNMPIGVIDSGVGGLSVLKCLRQELPGENFIYIGDTARAPYGSHTEAEIRQYLEEILCWLDKKQIKLAVIACNTLTVLGIDTIKKDHKYYLVGMSKGENLVLQYSENKKIGILATPFTISTNAHKKAILAIDNQAEVYPVACPKFVPLIENEKLSGQEVETAVTEYIENLQQNDVDTVILSCTHYPFIRKVIEKLLGTHVTIVDPAKETAFLTKKLLADNNLLNDRKQGDCSIYCTADVEKVKRLSAHMELVDNIKFDVVNLFE